MGLYVYIAGPITKGDQFHNVASAIQVAEKVRQQGHYPFIPHLTAFWHMFCLDDRAVSYEKWMEYDFAWINKCDVMVRIPGESSGSDREVKYFQDLGRPVFMGLEEFTKSIMWGL